DEATGAAHAARCWRRSSLRDRRCQPYSGQLFTSGQKRVLDSDVPCRGMSGASLLLVEIQAAHFYPKFLCYGPPHFVNAPLLQVAGRGRAANLRGNPSRIDRVREDLRPEAGDGEGQHEIEQF